MTRAAEQLLESFEQLQDTDKQSVVAEILRRTAADAYGVPDDAELLFAADQVFLELDRREAED